MLGKPVLNLYGGFSIKLAISQLDGKLDLVLSHLYSPGYWGEPSLVKGPQELPLTIKQVADAIEAIQSVLKGNGPQDGVLFRWTYPAHDDTYHLLVLKGGSLHWEIVGMPNGDTQDLWIDLHRGDLETLRDMFAEAAELLKIA